MSIQYLLVVINKIPTLLNLLSLRDICHIRQSCNDLKIEIDKKLTITTDNEDITVSCQDHFYSNKTIRDTVRDDTYVIINPFISDSSIFGTGYMHISGITADIEIVITEHDNNRILNCKITCYVRGEILIITDYIKKIRDDYYLGIKTCNYDLNTKTCHYIRINDNVICVIEGGEKNILIASRENKKRSIMYHCDSRLFSDVSFSDVLHNVTQQDENCPLQNAIRMVLEMN